MTSGGSFDTLLQLALFLLLFFSTCTAYNRKFTDLQRIAHNMCSLLHTLMHTGTRCYIARRQATHCKVRDGAQSCSFLHVAIILRGVKLAFCAAPTAPFLVPTK
ncbi:hypothetical protein F5B21DRAFT_437705 [Xylaria acuta]|nr:hypothetical protein F5B21DRAFT_437705 [Xylaria acuta]